MGAEEWWRLGKDEWRGEDTTGRHSKTVVELERGSVG